MFGFTRKLFSKTNLLKVNNNCKFQIRKYCIKPHYDEWDIAFYDIWVCGMPVWISGVTFTFVFEQQKNRFTNGLLGLSYGLITCPVWPIGLVIITARFIDEKLDGKS
jgi:hypothetical protein